MKNATEVDTPQQAIHSVKQKFVLWRNLTNLCYLGLITLFTITEVVRPQGFNLPVLAIQTLPLLIFIPGLLSQYYRVYSWLCFLILLYFIVAVMESLASTSNLGDYLFLLLTVAIFITSMMCSRYAQRVQKNIFV